MVSNASVLSVLSASRLQAIGRTLGVPLRKHTRKAEQIEALLSNVPHELPDWLGYCYRDELLEICRVHGVRKTTRKQAVLMQALLDAAGYAAPADTLPPLTRSAKGHHAPQPGSLVVVRHRHYVVNEVIAEPGATHVKLLGLDDDNAGRTLELIWELELGAQLVQPEAPAFAPAHMDAPALFAAYYHAMRWNRVTATDAQLLQAPFRAGIHLMPHQLTPLRKALELPRVNLLIADDVGLGKTIEAGLVAQELLLRQQADFIIIVAPASVCGQWQDEMQTRFGLRFEHYSRAFVQARRQARGFAVNPWATHARFVISYQTLRRPEYKEPLLAILNESNRRALLILDECHTAAPAAGGHYTCDSETTRTITELAPRFAHRLFLSATPHNGHSTSFSTLLSLLDRQRFTRGVPADKRQLSEVMVRRLKADLREVGADTGFPTRQVLAMALTRKDAPELELARLLAEYTRVAAPTSGRARLVFASLQKRLLSSPYAFAQSMRVHTEAALAKQPSTPLEVELDDDADLPDEDRNDAELATLAANSPKATSTVQLRLAELNRQAQALRLERDEKYKALLAWVRKHALGPSGRRVIVFTEYVDTKRYLRGLFNEDLDDESLIMEFHGGMSEAQRAEVQARFNSASDPVRILLATDAAREGLNLQAQCADLFHYDIPWNPARMEQRNGRIDRALQPAAEVRCHYFRYEHRDEDRVLEALVRKVATIAKEVGSLSTVVLERLEQSLKFGITSTTQLGEALAPDITTMAHAELETPPDHARLRKELQGNRSVMAASQATLDIDGDLLRVTLDQALRLIGCSEGFMDAGSTEEGLPCYSLPTMPAAWAETLDLLRSPRDDDQPFHEWRQTEPRRVVFAAPRVMGAEVVHLHLSHPVTQRLLSRLQAQGYTQRELARTTVVFAEVSEPHVIALGRLALFSPRAGRLHDQLISISAKRPLEGERRPLRPFGNGTSAKLRQAMHEALRQPADVPKALQAKLLAHAEEEFAQLWRSMRDEAEAEAQKAKLMLNERAQTEAKAMTALLHSQKQAIASALAKRQAQAPLVFNKHEKDTYDADTRAMRERLAAIAAEATDEPARIIEQYQVATTRVTPVGLVYLLPLALRKGGR